MDHAVECFVRHGDAMLFAWIFAQQAGLPIPTVPLLLAVGSMANSGRIHVAWSLVLALVACLIADSSWYQMGRLHSATVSVALRISLAPLSRNVKHSLTALEGTLTNPDRRTTNLVPTFSRKLFRYTSVHIHKEIREETNRMNRDGKAVRFHQAFNPATLEHSERHHGFLGNELRLIHDLTMAREVQQQLLQREVRNISGIDLATACVPACELGREFYDVLPYANGCVALALGDVSGKGTAAALLGASTMGILRAHTVDRVDSPTQVLAALNNRIHAARLESRFVVMLFAVLDSGTRRITLANSGTPYPLLLRNGEVKEIAASGIPLGVVKDSRYDSVSVDLQRGDVIVFVSDGIVECHNKKQEAFGACRLAAVLTSCSTDCSAQDMASAVLDATAEFRRDTFAPDDDRTLIVLKVIDEPCKHFSRLPLISEAAKGPEPFNFPHSEPAG